jgi:hypothetical protein
MPRTAVSRTASKRSAPDTASPPTPARHSKRARSAAQKSYAEPTTDTDGEATPDSAGASDYEAGNVKSASPSDQDDDDEVISDDDAPKPKSKAAQRKSLAKASSSDDAPPPSWKDGAKLTPGTQLIIKKPRARDAGDTPYADDRIHPNTMLFLAELAGNNNRPWLKREFVSCFLSCYFVFGGLSGRGREVISQRRRHLPRRHITSRHAVATM